MAQLGHVRLILALALAPMTSFGMDRLSALSSLETGNNDSMVGRAGEISRYQVLKAEWQSVTSSTNWRDPNVARLVTLKLLEQRVEKFKVRYKRNPTDFEFYALWNAPTQALTGRISRVVAERSQRFANLCGWNNGPVAALKARPSAAPAS
jgi:hypothetical protein